MTLAALIRKRDTGKAANANPANPANDGQGKAGTLATLATLALATCPGAIAAEPIPEAPERTPTDADARRERVQAMLDERPDTRYAVLVDDPDTDPVMLTLAIRGQATYELACPAAKFDPFELLAVLDRHGAKVH